MKRTFLRNAHEEADHQDSEHTLNRLADVAYWVGMARRVVQHCRIV